MSSISGASSGNGLFQFLQNVVAASRSQATAGGSTGSTSGSDSSTPVQGGHHHHHRSGGAQNSQLFQQLQQAVSNALQSTQEDGTDPNTAIKDAISQVFQNDNSANPASGTSSALSNGQPVANTPASVTSDASSTTSGVGAKGSSSLQAFFQTLQSFGVDPQQFHQDFLAAAQGAQNGTTTPSTAFQSFPPGSLVDTVG